MTTSPSRNASNSKEFATPAELVVNSVATEDDTISDKNNILGATESSRQNYVALHPWIVTISSTGAISEVRLDEYITTIGRSRGNSIMLDDPKVSRHHAELIYENMNSASPRPCVIFRDKGSRNGSYRNGTRVAGEVRLVHGDNLFVGGTTLNYYEGSKVESIVGEDVAKLVEQYGPCGISSTETQTRIQFPARLLRPGKDDQHEVVAIGLATNVTVNSLRLTAQLHKFEGHECFSLSGIPLLLEPKSFAWPSPTPPKFPVYIEWLHSEGSGKDAIVCCGLKFNTPQDTELREFLRVLGSGQA